jgi:hypothetical protein
MGGERTGSYAVGDHSVEAVENLPCDEALFSLGLAGSIYL